MKVVYFVVDFFLSLFTATPHKSTKPQCQEVTLKPITPDYEVRFKIVMNISFHIYFILQDVLPTTWLSTEIYTRELMLFWNWKPQVISCNKNVFRLETLYDW